MWLLFTSPHFPSLQDCNILTLRLTTEKGQSRHTCAHLDPPQSYNTANIFQRSRLICSLHKCYMDHAVSTIALRVVLRLSFSHLRAHSVLPLKRPLTLAVINFHMLVCIYLTHYGLSPFSLNTHHSAVLRPPYCQGLRSTKRVKTRHFFRTKIHAIYEDRDRDDVDGSPTVQASKPLAALPSPSPFLLAP